MAKGNLGSPFAEIIDRNSLREDGKGFSRL
jgi:hypothetical protein